MIHPVDYEPSQDFGDNPTRNLPASSWIIQQFGNYQPDGHTGVDYPCPVGTPVKAVAAGIVRHVGWMGGTYSDNPWWINPPFAGYHYVVDHGHFIGIYGHCQDGGARVVKGQRVAEGQVLGLSGNTGASTGPHLHFEVLPAGYILNSAMYGRIDPNSLFIGSITPQSVTITPLAPTEEGFLMALTEAEQRRVLAAADMTLDTPGRAEGPRLLNSADGGYIVALLEGVSGQVGRTLNKEDGGYLVGLVSALKPGQQDPAAIADAVVQAVGKDIATEVVKAISEKLGA